MLSGKGLTSMPNPRGPQPGADGDQSQYIGAMLTGTLSVLSTPDRAALEALTKTVRRLTPGSAADRTAAARVSKSSPIPRRPGDATPLRHVFYVIRENRTYDQIFGDLPTGNGDPSLCLFGEDSTPNAHALAREFVLLDNFYVNAEVSYDGHAYSTAAYATDFVEKVWPMNYAGRGGKYLSEGGGQNRNPYGNVTAPAGGYLWDACCASGRHATGATASSAARETEMRRKEGQARRARPSPASRGTSARLIRPGTSRFPTASGSTPGSRSSGNSKRTATCRGCRSSICRTTTRPERARDTRRRGR